VVAAGVGDVIHFTSCAGVAWPPQSRGRERKLAVTHLPIDGRKFWQVMTSSGLADAEAQSELDTGRATIGSEIPGSLAIRLRSLYLGRGRDTTPDSGQTSADSPTGQYSTAMILMLRPRFRRAMRRPTWSDRSGTALTTSHPFDVSNGLHATGPGSPAARSMCVASALLCGASAPRLALHGRLGW
jgi:hypothetical protein